MRIFLTHLFYADFPQLITKSLFLKTYICSMYSLATYMTTLPYVSCSVIVEIGPQHDTTTPSPRVITRPLECHAAKARSPFSDACFILHMKRRKRKKKTNSTICKWSSIQSDLSDAVSSNTRTALSCQRNTTSAARPKPSHAG